LEGVVKQLRADLTQEHVDLPIQWSTWATRVSSAVSSVGQGQRIEIGMGRIRSQPDPDVDPGVHVAI
jgi:hypothetical protein